MWTDLRTHCCHTLICGSDVRGVFTCELGLWTVRSHTWICLWPGQLLTDTDTVKHNAVAHLRCCYAPSLPLWQANRPPAKLNLLTCQVKHNPEEKRSFDLISRELSLLPYLPSHFLNSQICMYVSNTRKSIPREEWRATNIAVHINLRFNQFSTRKRQ